MLSTGGAVTVSGPPISNCGPVAGLLAALPLAEALPVGLAGAAAGAFFLPWGSNEQGLKQLHNAGKYEFTKQSHVSLRSYLWIVYSLELSDPAKIWLASKTTYCGLVIIATRANTFWNTVYSLIYTYWYVIYINRYVIYIYWYVIYICWYVIYV